MLAFYPRFAIDLSSSASVLPVPSLPSFVILRTGTQDGRSEGEEGKKRPRRTRPLTSFVTLISGSFVSGRVNERSRVLSEEALGPRCSRGENKRNKGVGTRGRRRAGSRDNGCGSYTLVACYRAGWKLAPADEEEVVARHQTHFAISPRFSFVISQDTFLRRQFLIILSRPSRHPLSSFFEL